MATTTKGKGFWVKISAKKWSDEKFASLSKEAQRAWLVLTCYAKDQETDGRITKRSLQVNDVTEAEVNNLIAGGYLEATSTGYQLLDYDEWQLTKAEVAEIHARNSGAGKASAAARAAKAAGEGALIPVPAGDVIDLAQEICKAWPAPSGGFSPEKVETITKALDRHEASSWPYVVGELNASLSKFYSSDDPKARGFLGSAGHKIREMIIPTAKLKMVGAYE